jgi:hypothetical protein
VSQTAVYRRLLQHSVQYRDIAWAKLHDASDLLLPAKAKLSLRLIESNAMKRYGGVEV